MKEKEELELILKLIGKYNLPLSPILEYAVKEKMDEYGGNGEENAKPETDESVETGEYVERDEYIETDEPAVGILNDEIEPSDAHTKKTLSKRRFVLATVKAYVRNHPDVSYETLLRVFPASLNNNKSNGVIKRYNDVLKKCSINPTTRNYYFLKEKEIIQLANGMKVVVNSLWGNDFEEFFKVAGTLFNVEKRGGGYVLDETTISGEEISSGHSRLSKDKRIGYTVRLFPSQQVGIIVNTNTDKNGIKQLVVRTNEGKVLAVDDLPYLYEVLKRNTAETAHNGKAEEKEKAKKSDTIAVAIREEATTTESRRGKPWTEYEEELIALYFKQGKDAATIGKVMGRTEVSIKIRLAKLGLIEYSYGQDDTTVIKQESSQTAKKLDDRVLYSEDILSKRTLDDSYTFVPKGMLKKISEVAEESYDFLLTMAVIEFMQFVPQPAIITFDRLACMMIAVAWEIFGEDEDAREKDELMSGCIQFLINESKEGMNNTLTWHSSRKDVFNAIKDYPMANVFEETVDTMVEYAPYDVLKAWINEEDNDAIVRNSNTPSATCLYAIHPMKRNPYIEVKQGWMRYLYNEHDSLMAYFKRLYIEFLS